MEELFSACGADLTPRPSPTLTGEGESSVEGVRGWGRGARAVEWVRSRRGRQRFCFAGLRFFCIWLSRFVPGEATVAFEATIAFETVCVSRLVVGQIEGRSRSAFDGRLMIGYCSTQVFTNARAVANLMPNNFTNIRLHCGAGGGMLVQSNLPARGWFRWHGWLIAIFAILRVACDLGGTTLEAEIEGGRHGGVRGGNRSGRCMRRRCKRWRRRLRWSCRRSGRRCWRLLW